MTETTFQNIKIGQEFKYGLRTYHKWQHLVTYQKIGELTARPTFGSDDHETFLFKPNMVVLVDKE